MADWQAIRAEYIAGGISQRDLAKKYGVPYPTMRKKSMAEGWVALRSQADSKATEKAVDAVADLQADRVAQLYHATDLLAQRVIEALEDGTASATDLRALSRTLLDIKDLRGVKSDADQREQEARIAKLQKESQEENHDSTIEIVMDDSLSDYCG